MWTPSTAQSRLSAWAAAILRLCTAWHLEEHPCFSDRDAHTSEGDTLLGSLSHWSRFHQRDIARVRCTASRNLRQAGIGHGAMASLWFVAGCQQRFSCRMWPALKLHLVRALGFQKQGALRARQQLFLREDIRAIISQAVFGCAVWYYF